MTVTHPAPYSKEVMEELSKIIAGWEGPILDPYAGTGRIHDLGRDDTWGIEIEPEWAQMHARTIWGDSATLRPLGVTSGECKVTSPAGRNHRIPRPQGLVFSPDYGNRMADQYLGTPAERMERQQTGKIPRRRSYAISLNRQVSFASTCRYQFGDTYRLMHSTIFGSATKVCVPGARLALNVSNSISGGEERDVTRWWLQLASSLGWMTVDLVPVETRRFRDGANREERVDRELILVAELKGQP